MNDPIRISPAVLRAVAGRHDEVADTIARARLSGADIQAALTSYGPIMHQVKAAMADVLALRDVALRAHDTSHRDVAEMLRRAATSFAAAEDLNEERLRLE